MKKILHFTTPEMIPNAKEIDLVLMVWGIESLVNDDTIRYGKMKQIPVLAIQANLDNPATKTSYEMPEYAAVWGESAYYSCVYAHNIKPN